MTAPRPAEPRERPPRLPEDGPTELVPTEDGDYVERLSGGTATMLLVWLIGTGAGSALLLFWVYMGVVLGQRLGAGDLFSAIGFYVGIFGASGPVVLWLAGRAQGHSFAWFAFTAAKIGALMAAIIIAIGALGALLVGAGITAHGLRSAGLLAAATFVLSLVWGAATWSADWYIARARTIEPTEPGGRP